MAGATLSHSNLAKIQNAPLPLRDTKKNLSDLTTKSLRDEAQIVRTDKEYSYASTSWLPVKTYYLLFNIMMTIQYLLTLDSASFNIGHAKCSETLTRLLAKKEIAFSQSALNTVYDGSIFDYREAPGANLRSASQSDQHAKLAMNKIAQYKLEDWKRRKKIPNFMTQRCQQEHRAFLQGFQLSVFEFPYHMRLRANYRDFAFIEGCHPTKLRRISMTTLLSPEGFAWHFETYS